MARIRSRPRRGTPSPAALAVVALALPATAAADDAGLPLARKPPAADGADDARASRDDAPAPPPPVEILVEGGARPPAPRDPSAAATVLRGEALERPGASLAELVADAPGVQIRRTGSDSDLCTASLRGATAAQTPVYLAGVRLNDDVTGVADLSTVPPFLIHRIEVYRGNAPAEADRLGIGGAILIEPRLPAGPELRLGELGGSHGARGAWLAAATGDARRGALVALRHDAARNDFGYLNDGGTRFERGDDRWVARTNADHQTWDLWAIGRYVAGDRARVTLVYGGFHREQGVTGLSVLPAAHSRARVGRQLVAVSTVVPCAAAADDRDRCSLELVTSGLVASTVLDDPARELALGSSTIATEGRRVAQGIRWRASPARAVSVTASGEQSVETLTLARTLDAPRGFSLAARRSVTRPAASVTISPTRTVELLALSALECHATVGPEGGSGCGAPQPVGRAGLRVTPAPFVDLLANAGRSVRVPTLGELYGLAPLVRGNPALEPETGANLELGGRARGAAPGAGLAAGFEAFAFRRRVEHLVSYRQSFRQLVPQNLGAARILGLELAGELRWRRALRLDTTVTLEDPRDVSPDRTLANDLLPLHSRLVLAQRLEGSLVPRRAGLERVTAAAQLRHRSSRYQDPAGLVVIPRQTTVDLEAALTLVDGRLALRAALENALDAPEWDLIGLALPGRSLTGSLEARLP